MVALKSQVVRRLIISSCLVLVLSAAGFSDQYNSTPPNFVIIFTDDQGYGDLACFGGSHVRTPHIDQLAAEGAQLTSFYVAAPLCTPSRAALMTGCYPKRVSLATGSNFPVLLAGDPKGLHPDEITLAEILRGKGYATGIFGKWHLGDQAPFLPTQQGFDAFFGIPYSHDIHPFHPRQDRFHFPPLPLMDGDRVIEAEPDADYLTRRITDRAVAFIAKHRERPFFLYIPHPIPHQPLHVSPPYMEDVPDEIKATLAKENGSIDYKTRNQLFQQAIREIDDSVARIVTALKEYHLEQNTLVLFTSDNGPAVGSAGPLRGRKGSAYEGGMREPTVAWWPGKIPAGYVCKELLTSMDVLPTFARLAGADLPGDRVIDGKDITDVLLRPGAKTPHERFFYHQGNRLRAVRSGPWKLYVGPNKKDQDPPGVPEPELYNLENDIRERLNVAAKHPDIVARLTAAMQNFERELGPGDQLSSNCRPAGWIDQPRPLIPHEPLAPCKKSECE